MAELFSGVGEVAEAFRSLTALACVPVHAILKSTSLSLLAQLRCLIVDFSTSLHECLAICGKTIIQGTYGMQSAKYDCKRGDETFLSVQGWARCIALALRIKEGGLLMAALPCCGWVWLSSSRHCRTRSRPQGNPQSKWVASHNTMAGRLCLILLLCTVRRVYWFVENPRSSMLFYYPSFQSLMSLQDDSFGTKLFHCWWQL